MAVCTSILKDNYKTLIASPNEEKSNEARLETDKLFHQGSYVGLYAYEKDNIIKFINGSSIEFVIPEKASDTIRGKRSKLPMWLYDYECYNQDNFNKAVESFINKL